MKNKKHTLIGIAFLTVLVLICAFCTYQYTKQATIENEITHFHKFDPNIEPAKIDI